jgi:hypothetical protein
MTSPSDVTTADKELGAIGTILRALDGLEADSVQRVLDYVLSRLSITAPSFPKPYSAPSPSPSSANQPSAHGSHLRLPSIRDLKEDKQPESSNQMAALVAYYLSEVLGQHGGKDAINAADLEKYFKQAGFRLPQSLSQTLPNATAAGYLDAVGNGLYKLNPVGYNLIVHGLPRTHKKSIPKKRGSPPRGPKA